MRRVMMTVHGFRWRPLVAIGLVSGLIEVTIGVALYLTGVYFAPGSLVFVLLVLAACIAFGTRWYARHVLDGRTTYWSAMLVGLVIGVCTGLVYVTYNVVSISFVYPGFLEDMVQAEFARQKTLGMNPSEAAQTLESLRREMTLWRLIAENLSGFVRFGIVLSAFTAIAFRRKSKKHVAVARP
jgi:hypothetical protein